MGVSPKIVMEKNLSTAEMVRQLEMRRNKRSEMTHVHAHAAGSPPPAAETTKKKYYLESDVAAYQRRIASLEAAQKERLTKEVAPYMKQAAALEQHVLNMEAEWSESQAGGDDSPQHLKERANAAEGKAAKYANDMSSALDGVKPLRIENKRLSHNLGAAQNQIAELERSVSKMAEQRREDQMHLRWLEQAQHTGDLHNTRLDDHESVLDQKKLVQQPDACQSPTGCAVEKLESELRLEVAKRQELEEGHKQKDLQVKDREDTLKQREDTIQELQKSVSAAKDESAHKEGHSRGELQSLRTTKTELLQQLEAANNAKFSIEAERDNWKLKFEEYVDGSTDKMLQLTNIMDGQVSSWKNKYDQLAQSTSSQMGDNHDTFESEKAALEEEKERMIEMVEQFTADRAMEKAALESERDRWRLKSEQFTADFASEKAQLTAGFASEKLELEAQMNTWVVKCEQYTANEFASNTDMQDMAEATKEMKEKLQIAENSRGEAYGKLIDSNMTLSNEKATLTKELVAALDQVARLQEQVSRSGSGAEGANGWILDGK